MASQKKLSRDSSRTRLRLSLRRRGDGASAMPAALRAAFDYRGDVTLTLEDGSSLEGYVGDAGPDAVRVWPRDGSEPVAIAPARVRQVALTGRDPVRRSA